MSFLFDYICTRLPFISWSIAGVPSSQALPGYLITAPPSVCVPDVIGAVAVWIQKQKQKKNLNQKPKTIKAVVIMAWPKAHCPKSISRSQY